MSSFESDLLLLVNPYDFRRELSTEAAITVFFIALLNLVNHETLLQWHYSINPRC